MEQYDVIVIGGGPAGYVCAIRASQLGMKVALVEKRNTLGGTCLNVGCIPSKALLDSSEQYHFAKEKLKEHGVEVGSVQLNFTTMMKRKEKVVSEVVKGVDFLMKKNKIKRYLGLATLQSNNKVAVQGENEKAEISASKIVIATGSIPAELPFLPFDGKKVISSTEALSLKKVPKKLAIVGAGVIGLELGSVYARLGSEVHIIELLPNLLPTCDGKIASYAKRLLESQGLKFYMEHKVKGLEKSSLLVETPKGDTININADVILVATGRKPFTENLGLEKIGIQLDEKGRIPVNEKYETNVSGVYAIGDVIKGPMLAHKAMEEGIAVAEMMAGKYGHVNYKAIPYIVYTWPEIAWVGMGEEEAKKQGYDIKIGKAFFKANGRAKAMGETDGQVKVIADKKTDDLLGLFILGPRASDMIAEAAIAMEFSASAEDIARSIHAHPTLSEVVLEAALDAEKRAIHA
ncbi:MAG: dihydrolipoyl dehydrogenase [Candidatus Hydrogenedentota bacterium]|nr:MAG: dihydrolipoyl dehydrogenase [Candidatus Hydrogenedentota bacterium]